MHTNIRCAHFLKIIHKQMFKGQTCYIRQHYEMFGVWRTVDKKLLYKCLQFLITFCHIHQLMLFKYNYCSGVTYHQKFDFLVPFNLTAIFLLLGKTYQVIIFNRSKRFLWSTLKIIQGQISITKIWPKT